MICLAISPARAAVVYVNINATGANTGANWANAYTSLQSALTTAVSGDEIWVAAGIYKPTGTTDRTISFALKNGMGVYGGFAGGETLRSQRNPSTNVTILSGDIGVPGNASDNSYHVVTSGSTVTITGVLAGFTISGGNANGSSASSQDRGGGMWVNGGSPTISHCVFFGNSASEKGGGLRATSASPAIDGCVFTSNSGGAGGGGIGTGSGSSFTVSNTVFRSNSTVSTLAGAGLDAASGVTVVNCVFQGNSGNGIYFAVGGTIINSTFTGNSSYGVAFQQDGTVVNSILWGDAVDEVFVGFGTITVTYSDVGGSGFGGTGNKSANPLFLNAGAGDLRLGPGSPAVDAGNNAAVPGGLTTDIAGLPRFFDDPAEPDTGAGTPPIVDMGANERVPLSVSNPSSQSMCAGNSASFSVTASGQPPLTYRWRKNGSNLSDGGSISGSATTTLTINPTSVADSGSYDVVVTDGFGQNLASAAATLTVKAVPSPPTAGNNGPICAGQTLQLTASTVSGATYAWTGPNGFASAQQNPSIASATTAASGTYNVTATVNGCTSSAATTVATVNPLPVATITAPASACPKASGLTVSVPDAGPGANYSWSITNGTITGGAGTRTITFSAGATGTVSLNVTVTNANGCAASGSAAIPVSACPAQFYTLAPCRLIDTRNPSGPNGGPSLIAGANRTFVLANLCGIPSTARAVSLNVVVVLPTTGPGHLTVYPAGAPQPVSATINYNKGNIRANNSIMPLGASGDVTVFCGQGSGTADLVVDTNGYFQ